MGPMLVARQPANRPVTELAGRAVTVMGLGTHGGGVAAARWLAQQGARVTISDQAPESALAGAIASLADVPIARWSLGGHRWEDFSEAELVVVNPAVPPHSPWLRRIAAEGAARITSEIELFLERCPAVVVGVTGTVGKSTTASLLAEMLRAAGRRAWLGGNIGVNLLADLPTIGPDHMVVLELSSFQLHYLGDDARWPEIAVVTNLSENHLAWHGGFVEYAAAKRRLVEHAQAAVMNPADEALAAWCPSGARRIVVGPAPSAAARGWGRALPGPHQEQNAALAAAAASAVGADAVAIEAGIAGFAGLPHRLELVATVADRRLVNDSKATTPAAVVAALNACDTPTWLLVGGLDKGGDWSRVAMVAAKRVRAVATFGRDAAPLASHFAAAGVSSQQFEHLIDAANWCWQQSQPGDTILLSPGCASFDQFVDFHHRGVTFCRWAESLAETDARGI